MHVDLAAVVARDLDLEDTGAVPVVSLDLCDGSPPTASSAALFACSTSGPLTCSPESPPTAYSTPPPPRARTAAAAPTISFFRSINFLLWSGAYETECGVETLEAAERKLRAALEWARSNGQELGRWGRRSVNVEPSPGALLTRISPPWDSAIWRAMESPRPAPPSAREGSVLWKRSKTRGSSSSGIPTPVSETSSATRPSSSRNLTATLPPSGVYFTALSRSMEAAWRTRPLSKVAWISRSGGTYST